MIINDFCIQKRVFNIVYKSSLSTLIERGKCFAMKKASVAINNRWWLFEKFVFAHFSRVTLFSLSREIFENRFSKAFSCLFEKQL